MDNFLVNDAVWITGASTGIGAAVALGYAAKNVDLILTARNEVALNNLATQIKEIKDQLSSKGKVVILPLDVTDRASVKNAFNDVSTDCNRISTIILNAGTYIPSDTGDRFSVDEYVRQMELNYFGMLYCIEAAYDHLKEIALKYNIRPNLVAVSSVIGYRGVPLAAGYSATKAAMINFLQTLRMELKSYNIDVLIVNPAFVKTPLTDRNKFPMPFRISAEQAAKYILRGIDKKYSEIHFPPYVSWIFKFLRVIPYPIYEFIISKLVYAKGRKLNY